MRPPGCGKLQRLARVDDIRAERASTMALGFIDVRCKDDVSEAKRELTQQQSHSTEADDGDAFSRLSMRDFQRVKRNGSGLYQHSLIIRHETRYRPRKSRWHTSEFRKTALLRHADCSFVRADVPATLCTPRARATRKVRFDHYSLAQLQGRDFGSPCLNDTDALMPQDERILDGPMAMEKMNVRSTQADFANADQHFVCFGLGRGNLQQCDLVPTQNACGFHAQRKLSPTLSSENCKFVRWV
jgi:hypothetical protein